MKTDQVVDILNNKAEMEKWLKFTFSTDPVAAMVRDYCNQYNIGNLEMFQAITVLLAQQKVELIQKVTELVVCDSLITPPQKITSL